MMNYACLSIFQLSFRNFTPAVCVYHGFFNPEWKNRKVLLTFLSLIILILFSYIVLLAPSVWAMGLRNTPAQYAIAIITLTYIAGLLFSRSTRLLVEVAALASIFTSISLGIYCTSTAINNALIEQHLIRGWIAKDLNPDDKTIDVALLDPLDQHSLITSQISAIIQTMNLNNPLPIGRLCMVT